MCGSGHRTLNSFRHGQEKIWCDQKTGGIAIITINKIKWVLFRVAAGLSLSIMFLLSCDRRSYTRTRDTQYMICLFYSALCVKVVPGCEGIIAMSRIVGWAGLLKVRRTTLIAIYLPVQPKGAFQRPDAAWLVLCPHTRLYSRICGVVGLLSTRSFSIERFLLVFLHCFSPLHFSFIWTHPQPTYLVADDDFFDSKLILCWSNVTDGRTRAVFVNDLIFVCS